MKKYTPISKSTITSIKQTTPTLDGITYEYPVFPLRSQYPKPPPDKKRNPIQRDINNDKT